MDNKCEYSENGLCMHFLSQGELKCDGSESQQGNCMEFVEVYSG